LSAPLLDPCLPVVAKHDVLQRPLQLAQTLNHDELARKARVARHLQLPLRLVAKQSRWRLVLAKEAHDLLGSICAVHSPL
jgi:hypothetical protein